MRFVMLTLRFVIEEGMDAGHRYQRPSTDLYRSETTRVDQFIDHGSAKAQALRRFIDRNRDRTNVSFNCHHISPGTREVVRAVE